MGSLDQAIAMFRGTPRRVQCNLLGAITRLKKRIIAQSRPGVPAWKVDVLCRHIGHEQRGCGHPNAVHRASLDLDPDRPVLIAGRLAENR